MKNILIAIRILITLSGMYLLVFSTEPFNGTKLIIGLACLVLASNTIIVWDVPSSPKQKEDHKMYLLTVYRSYMSEWSVGTFHYLMFQEAIRKLEADVEPQLVEDWLVRIENNWKTLK